MQTENQKNADTGGAKGALKDDVVSTLKEETASARETLHDARDKIQRKAGEYASEAKAAAFEQAEGAQKGIGETIAALGGAMRAAGDHLAQGDQNTMSRLMNDVAAGVERFSDSLRNKKFDEILDDVRTLGRDNPGAVFAGSMLAGLALGRFVKSSASHKEGQDAQAGGKGRPQPETPGQWSEPASAASSSSGQADIFGEDSGEKRP